MTPTFERQMVWTAPVHIEAVVRAGAPEREVVRRTPLDRGSDGPAMDQLWLELDIVTGEPS